jgi:hypothetical protein
MNVDTDCSNATDEIRVTVGPSIVVRGTGDLVSKDTLRLLVAPINLPRIRRAGHVILYSNQRRRYNFHFFFKHATQFIYIDRRLWVAGEGVPATLGAAILFGGC